jgi:hypothetical protein
VEAHFVSSVCAKQCVYKWCASPGAGRSTGPAVNTHIQHSTESCDLNNSSRPQITQPAQHFPVAETHPTQTALLVLYTRMPPSYHPVQPALRWHVLLPRHSAGMTLVRDAVSHNSAAAQSTTTLHPVVLIMRAAAGSPAAAVAPSSWLWPSAAAPVQQQRRVAIFASTACCCCRSEQPAVPLRTPPSTPPQPAHCSCCCGPQQRGRCRCARRLARHTNQHTAAAAVALSSGDGAAARAA